MLAAFVDAVVRFVPAALASATMVGTVPVLDLPIAGELHAGWSSFSFKAAHHRFFSMGKKKRLGHTGGEPSQLSISAIGAGAGYLTAIAMSVKGGSRGEIGNCVNKKSFDIVGDGLSHSVRVATYCSAPGGISQSPSATSPTSMYAPQRGQSCTVPRWAAGKKLVCPHSSHVASIELCSETVRAASRRS